MKAILIVIISLLSLGQLKGQDIEIIMFDDLEPRLQLSNDTVYLVNFWATWCKPCTEEMPDFVRVNSELEHYNFKMLLVSLDLPGSIDKGLKKFIEDYNIVSEVVLLDDVDFNSWINRVDKSWSGSIPATLMYYPGERKFVEGTLDYEKIMEFVKPGLKKSEN